MEGFSAPAEKKLRPTDEPKKIETREDKVRNAEEAIAAEFNKRFAEMSVGQSFETERSF